MPHVHTIRVRQLRNGTHQNSSTRKFEAGAPGANRRPKVIDLFAGVGGFSLGAIRAGFDVVAAVDLDKHAIAAHKKNFPRTAHKQRNIANLTGEALLQIASLEGEDLAGLIGGPPCQGFSVMGGRRKNDRRNSLFFHFFRLVSETQPLFFVAENVPGNRESKIRGSRRGVAELSLGRLRLREPLRSLCQRFWSRDQPDSRLFHGNPPITENTSIGGRLHFEFSRTKNLSPNRIGGTIEPRKRVLADRKKQLEDESACELGLRSNYQPILRWIGRRPNRRQKVYRKARSVGILWDTPRRGSRQTLLESRSRREGRDFEISASELGWALSHVARGDR